MRLAPQYVCDLTFCLLQVGRDTTFRDGMDQVLRGNVMDQAVPCVLAPTFIASDRAVEDKIRCGLPKDGTDGVRTEFFMRTGLEMVDMQPGGLPVFYDSSYPSSTGPFFLSSFTSTFA
jgi:hypothetical protein